MNQDTPIYSSDPRVEEMMVELNGDSDYWAEIAASERLGSSEADMDDFRDEEEWDAQSSTDAITFDLNEDIPF